MSYITKDCELTVEHKEIGGSPTGTIAHDGSVVVRVLEVAWDKWMLLAEQLAGRTVSRGSDIITFRPHRYKDKNLYIRDVDFKPIGTMVADPDDIQYAQYELAQLIARYRSPERPDADEEDAPGGVYATENFDPAAEFLTLPREDLMWKSDSKPIQASEAPGILVGIMEWSYTLHRCPNVPSALLDIIGCVNNKTYKAKAISQSFAVETLLCGNPHIQNEVLSDGTTAYAITARFLWRRMGWNKFPRASITGQAGLIADTIKTAIGDVKPYKPISFDAFINYSPT